MSLSHYCSAAVAQLRELEESLSPDDRTALRAELDTLGAAAWATWQAAHDVEIDRYARATPHTRAQRASWQDPPHRRKLTLASMYIHDKARQTLALLADFPFAGNLSYRTMALDAALLCDRFRQLDTPQWPFDEDGNCTYS